MTEDEPRPEPPTTATPAAETPVADTPMADSSTTDTPTLDAKETTPDAVDTVAATPAADTDRAETSAIGTRPGWHRWWNRTVLILGIPFLALHLYGALLAVLPVPLTANMVMRPDGTALQRNWVPLESISPHLVRAVIAAEDSRFCAHGGIDWDALQDAVAENREGGRRRGGSTITQQTAKNVFLWNGGGYARKAAEAYVTLYIDTFWSKRRVMEVYLNIAEWGDGIFGADAAAQARFGTAADALGPREAALLAAVLPNPNTWRVDPPGPYVGRRVETLTQRARVVQTEGLAECVLKKRSNQKTKRTN